MVVYTQSQVAGRHGMGWCALQGWCGAYPGAGELCLMPKASAKMMHHSQALYVFSVYVGACHTFFYHIRAATRVVMGG